MWGLQGDLSVDGFDTTNSEFHLDHVRATLKDLRIFELEISHDSHVVADHLDLVFLSTHTGERDEISFSDIATGQSFSRKLNMGSGATAEFKDTRAQLFLLYVHGSSSVQLHHVGRTQLAFFPRCAGKLQLRHGHLGTKEAPFIVPEGGDSDCPFRFTLDDVDVDTWDVYAGGDANLMFHDSVIDELNANDRANLVIRDSELYADWMAVAQQAQVRIENSTVGALRLAQQRPDLATSQIRLSGQSHSVFSHVRFDCGIVAGDSATAELLDLVVPPKYVRTTGKAVVNEGNSTTKPFLRRNR
jgi:hypothetical protein